ncbi:MAG: DUF1512 domain-containing protein [Thaumarchaeota archaeon]|nr:DUF1512 domain-containing protein [Nitrososphaerota archaeon]
MRKNMAFTIDASFISTLVNVLYIGTFVAFFLYGQRFQLAFMQRGIKGQVSKLDRMQLAARTRLVDSLKKFSGNSVKPIDNSVDRLLGSFVISPVSMDPSGIVPKMEHILDSADENLKGEIRRIAPQASEPEIQTLSNVAEIAIGLNNMFKVVRHFYILGSKPGGTYSLVQLQMLMPQLMEAADAYSSAMNAFVNGQTLGDGFGPLVASELVGSIGGSTGIWTETVKDTEVAKLDYQNHVTYVIKAKGPGGNIGKPGQAIQQLMKQDPSIKYVLTVDAALKLEGEETGSLAEGVGAAIGGPGVERFRIEETASSNQIEMLALVAKMSEKEAITEIPKSVKDRVPSTVERIRSIISGLPEGTSIIIAGIGNTMGVA